MLSTTYRGTFVRRAEEKTMDQLPEVVFHVYPADCDMLGHVNHATMLAFLERARKSV